MMTPQETQALRDFLAQLTQVQGVQKDAQAASMIGAAFAQQPDAGYLLVQRSMLQDLAVANARDQIAQLQAQLQAEREGARSGAGTGGGFLDPANGWGNSAVDAGRGANAFGGRMSQQQPQRYDGTPAPQYTPAQAQQYASAPAQRPGLFGGGGGGLLGGGGGGGSFLGSMAATAAGVAGGAFLFQGIGNMMGHHGGASGLMGQNNASLPAENTTGNNSHGADAQSAGNSERNGLADSSINDAGGSADFGGSDDLGSSDDMSSI